MGACKFPNCDEAASKERKSIFCDAHFADWMRSPEWREATQDEKVRFFMQLGCTEDAMRHVNKHARKWAKRAGASEDTP